MYPDLTYFTDRKCFFDVTIINDPQIFPVKYLYQVKDQNGVLVDMYTPDITSYVSKYTGYDIVLVGWRPSDYDTKLSHTGGYTYPQKINGMWCATVRQDGIPYYAIHELHHILVRTLWERGHTIDSKYPVFDYMDIDKQGRPFFHNEDINFIGGNYYQTWQSIQPYLNELTNMYKYFKDSEVVGLKPEFVKLLDQARGIAGVPFIIT